MNLHKLTADLKRDEGFVPHAYQDHLGFWTIGIGHLIDKRKGGGITERVANFILADDIANVETDLDRSLPWRTSLSEPRQRALANMCFQMGISGLLAFRMALTALEAGDYETAADEFADSLWAREQTPERASRVVELIRSG